MSDIDEIKSRLNIVDVIGERVKLVKAGRNFKALCPFHSEKTPSFMVSADRQMFKCFGCGKGGSVIDFVMEYEHIDFPEALEELADRAGVKLTRRPADSPQAKLKERIFEVNHLASEFYQYLLTKHAHGEKARLYLKNRGISDKSIKTFALGYSPNSWDGLQKFLNKKGYDNELLETAGLSLKGTKGFYDRFRGRVMFTLKDHRGNVVGFAGRVLDPHEKEAKYINTSETPVYVKSNVLYGLDVTKAAIQETNDAILMEGELDVISSFQAGIPNAVAIKGSALTEAHVALLRRFTERLTFALDADVAGDAAARRGIEIAERAGLDMRVVAIPGGKDPDEAARENPGVLKKAIKDAVPIYDYFLTSAMSRYDAATPFGKKKISEELVPTLAKIENPIVAGHYVRLLARTLGVGEETVHEAIARHRRGTPTPKGEQSTPSGTFRSRHERIELHILALLLQGKTVEFAQELREEVPHEVFVSVPVKRVLGHLYSYISKNKAFFIKEFLETMAAELVPTADEAMLWDIADILSDESELHQEWNRAVRELKKLVVRKEIKILAGSIAAGHGTKSDQKDLSELMARLKSLENEG
jgi:DNA primase